MFMFYNSWTEYIKFICSLKINWFKVEIDENEENYSTMWLWMKITCSMFWPLLTHSVPTRTRGFVSAFKNFSWSTPKQKPAFIASKTWWRQIFWLFWNQNLNVKCLWFLVMIHRTLEIGIRWNEKSSNLPRHLVPLALHAVAAWISFHPYA